MDNIQKVNKCVNTPSHKSSDTIYTIPNFQI
jgi:hypothetical protein